MHLLLFMTNTSGNWNISHGMAVGRQDDTSFKKEPSKLKTKQNINFYLNNIKPTLLKNEQKNFCWRLSSSFFSPIKKWTEELLWWKILTVYMVLPCIHETHLSRQTQSLWWYNAEVERKKTAYKIEIRWGKNKLGEIYHCLCFLTFQITIYWPI